MDTSIIAILAGSGGAIATAFLISPWKNWTIKRLSKDRDDLRSDLRVSEGALALVKSERDTLGAAFNEALAERDEARRQLSAAGKPDKQAISDWARQMQARSTAVRMAKRAGAGA